MFQDKIKGTWGVYSQGLVSGSQGEELFMLMIQKQPQCHLVTGHTGIGQMLNR